MLQETDRTGQDRKRVGVGVGLGGGCRTVREKGKGARTCWITIGGRSARGSPSRSGRPNVDIAIFLQGRQHDAYPLPGSPPPPRPLPRTLFGSRVHLRADAVWSYLVGCGWCDVVLCDVMCRGTMCTFSTRPAGVSAAATLSWRTLSTESSRSSSIPSTSCAHSSLAAKEGAHTMVAPAARPDSA